MGGENELRITGDFSAVKKIMGWVQTLLSIAAAKERVNVSFLKGKDCTISSG